MKTFTFTLKLKRNFCPITYESFSARLEIHGNPTLYELGECLVEAVGFQLDHPFGFYDNLRSPYGKCNEKYTVFADVGLSQDGEPGVEKTLVEDVFTEGKKMLFLFDYGDEWHFHVTCQKIDDPLAIRGWELISSEGKRPMQYASADEEFGNG
jgi:Plasmid pRiA4b ORF-3-like protein